MIKKTYKYETIKKILKELEEKTSKRCKATILAIHGSDNNGEFLEYNDTGIKDVIVKIHLNNPQNKFLCLWIVISRQEDQGANDPGQEQEITRQKVYYHREDDEREL